MKQRIIINADAYETRVAILEHDELAELFVERAESIKAYGLVKHRHLAEVEEQLALHTGAKTVIPARASARCRSACSILPTSARKDPINSKSF